MKPWFLKLHRWMALVLALPLMVIAITGMILSFEPWLIARSIVPNSLTATKLQSLLAEHDPKGQARALSLRSYDQTLTLGGSGSGGTSIDLATMTAGARPSVTATVLQTARRLHHSLMLDANWLVILATVGLLILSLLGVLIGRPHIANSVAGWHMGIAWGLLPLLLLAPFTGLMLSAGVTLSGGAAAPKRSDASSPPPLSAAVTLLGRDHDLSGLQWLRPRGDRMLARIVEDGEFRVYNVTASGAEALPRNWPRLWHDGTIGGLWSVAKNVVVSVALVVLLVTGVWIWARRRLRHRTRHRHHDAPPRDHETSVLGGAR